MLLSQVHEVGLRVRSVVDNGQNALVETVCGSNVVELLGDLPELLCANMLFAQPASHAYGSHLCYCLRGGDQAGGSV